jgi:octaprenyl-diphosphate synthase
MSFARIQQPVEQELKEMRAMLAQAFCSKVRLIEEVGEHILQGGGKRLRPLLVLLCAKACSYAGRQHIVVAALIELIHTATLLHDDVVDEASERRAHKTANAQWGNEAAILVGDFLYSKAFQLLLDIHHPPIMQILVKTTNQMAEGEALQLLKRRTADLLEADYLEIIAAKTAQLFEAAAESAAVLSGAPENIIRALKHYGFHLGMAFQLIDDVLDYQMDHNQTGKNPGQDLREGKMTLPLIYSLAQGSALEIELIQAAIADCTPQRFANVLDIVTQRGGLEYTRHQAQIQAGLAQAALDQLPTSDYRTAARALADFVIDRQH